jgi:FkbM family methyltransferase
MAQLSVFSIPKGFVDPHISLIQRNAVRSWVALGAEVLLMGDDPGVAEVAGELGAIHVGEAAKNEFGTPLLDWAFSRAAQRATGEWLCYANADILLLPDFLAAVSRLPAQPLLGIGQRWDCDINEPIDFERSAQDLAAWARSHGKLDLGSGSDYFVYPRHTDFGIPPFAVGRPGWDNWMMGRTLELGFPLIDMTPSTTVIHQNHDYRHVAARSGSNWEGPEADRNRELAGWIDRYVHNPGNATRLLTPSGLVSARSMRHLRAKAEEFVALRPAAAPLRSLVRAVRSRQAPAQPQSEPASASEGLSKLASHPMLMPFTARLICARLLRESPRFFVRELLRPEGVYLYRLRDGGATVALRHSVQDGATLAEVFHRSDYEPPAELAVALAAPGRILDLGANVGLFGIYAARRWPEASIVGYEADPDNVAVHAAAIAANGLAARWRVEPVAAGARDGQVELAAGRAMGSFVVEPGTDPGVPTIQVPVRDVMREIAEADLVKLDIEGGEWEILADERFRREPPAIVVLEYHPHLGPGGDPRAAAEQALRDAGMSIADIWHRPDGYGMVWAWRPGVGGVD